MSIAAVPHLSGLDLLVGVIDAQQSIKASLQHRFPAKIAIRDLLISDAVLMISDSSMCHSDQDDGDGGAAPELVSSPSPEPLISTQVGDTHKACVVLGQSLDPRQPNSSRECPAATVSLTSQSQIPAPPNTVHVVGYCPQVAQKSYSGEKRFLVPPPLLQLDPARSILDTISPLSGVSQNALVSMPSEGPTVMISTSTTAEKPVIVALRHLVDKTRVLFRNLFVTSDSRSKDFRLSVQVSISSLSLPFGLLSPPIALISKPSKKSTHHFRSNSLVITNGQMVSLFNRINSQTVRTKFVLVSRSPAEGGWLFCGKSEQWSPLTIHLSSRAQTSSAGRLTNAISYGAMVFLKDEESGHRTVDLIIRRVEKGRVVRDATGLVGQLHKVVLERMTEPGSMPSYWALPSSDSDFKMLPVLGGSKDEIGFQVGDSEWVADQLCWSIVGINRFDHTFDRQN